MRRGTGMDFLEKKNKIMECLNQVDENHAIESTMFWLTVSNFDAYSTANKRWQQERHSRGAVHWQPMASSIYRIEIWIVMWIVWNNFLTMEQFLYRRQTH